MEGMLDWEISIVGLIFGSDVDQQISSPIRHNLPFEQLLDWISDAQSNSARISSLSGKDGNFQSKPFRLNLAVFDGSGGYAGNIEAQARRRHPAVERLLSALHIPQEALVRKAAVEFNSYPPAAKTSSVADIYALVETSRTYSVARDVFGVAWRWNEELKTTAGVIWSIYPEGLEQIAFILEALEKEQALLEHPMILAHLALRTTVLCLERWVWKDIQKIVNARAQIGYRRHVEVPPGRPSGQPADPARLSGEVSGFATRLISSVLCLHGIVNFSKFILDENDSFLESRKASKDLRETNLLHRYVDRHTKMWQRKAAAELLHCETWVQKAAIVVQGLLSLIAKRDQEISIGIAQDSRILAQEAKRDTTSMKTIAAVTMAFLPGTFVSSLFAMPMFDWDASENRLVSHCFWIYWAVTLPLTVAVFVTWLVIVLYSKRPERALEEKQYYPRSMQQLRRFKL